MKEKGKKPKGLERGNAWDLHEKGASSNWIVGETPLIPLDSLRFMEQDNSEGTGGRKAKNIAVKWFVHKPTDKLKWGIKKPTSKGRSMSLLASKGRFELVFWKGSAKYTLTLDKPGDFAVWGPGLEHSWRPVKKSTIITFRWVPLEH